MEERGRLDPELIDRVRTASDIVAVAGDYVRLKKSGHSYSGLCPFHNERTPSFTVSPEKQLFYCFGCGAGGNVFQFLMRAEGLDFGQAVRLLADRAGIPIQTSALTPAQEAEESKRKRMLAMLDWTAKYYRWFMMEKPAGEKARAYIKSRGVTPEIAEAFAIGYAPSSWEALAQHLRRRKYDLAEAELAGLVTRRQDGSGYYDRFRDRLMFPIRDPLGRVIGFGGRTLGDGEPKYLNSPETRLFSKGRVLYGMERAKEAIRSTGEAVLVEGYLDAVMAHQFSITNTVASLGTALTAEQIKLMGRYGRKVVISYDADTAGEAATWRGLELVRAGGLEVQILTLPEGDDPDTFLLREGAGAFQQKIKEGVPLTEYMLGTILSRNDLNTSLGRGQAVKEIFPVLGGISAPTEREFYLSWTADKLGVGLETLRQELRSLAGKAGNTSRDRHTLPSASYNRNNISEPPALEQAMLRWFLTEPAWYREAMTEGETDGFTHPLARSLVASLSELGWGNGLTGVPQLVESLGSEELRSLVASLIMQDDIFGIENKKELCLKWRKYCWQSRLGNLWRRLTSAEQKSDLTALNQVVLEYKTLRKVFHGLVPAEGRDSDG